MRLLSIIILTLIINPVSGQSFENDSIINRLIKHFSNNGRDTVLIYENGCVGCIYLADPDKTDSCDGYNNQNTYVFWKNKGVSYVTEMSNNNDCKYDTIKYDLTHIWDLYFKNKSAIKNERILPPTYVNKKDTILIFIDHYDYKQITVIDKKSKVEFRIIDYYFDKLADEKNTNINYKRNSRTYRRELQIQVKKVIKTINDNKFIEVSK